MTDDERLDFIAGNDFAKLGFLQDAQMHLMKPASKSYLTVSLDGDLDAIACLQFAECDLMEDVINQNWKRGYLSHTHDAEILKQFSLDKAKR
jgi:hypothetical protein